MSKKTILITAVAICLVIAVGAVLTMTLGKERGKSAQDTETSSEKVAENTKNIDSQTESSQTGEGNVSSETENEGENKEANSEQNAENAKEHAYDKKMPMTVKNRIQRILKNLKASSGSRKRKILRFLFHMKWRVHH